MKMIFAILLILTSVSFANHPLSPKEMQERQEKVKKLRENICATDSSEDISKTEAVGACPECAEKSSKDKIAEIKIDLSKNEIQKRDFQFLRLMKKTGRFDLGRMQICSDLKNCEEFLKGQELNLDKNKEMIEQSKKLYEKSYQDFQSYLDSDLKTNPLPLSPIPHMMGQPNQANQPTQVNHNALTALMSVMNDTTDPEVKKKIEAIYAEITKGSKEILLDPELIPAFVEKGKKIEAPKNMMFGVNPETMIQQIKGVVEGLKDEEKEKRYIKKPASDEEELKQYQRQAEVVIDQISHNQGFRRCNLTTAEIFAVVDYSGNGYVLANAALREGGEKAATYEVYKQVLNSALGKLRKHDEFVDRGANLPEKVLEQYQVGAIVDSPAFTSTSAFTGFGGKQKFSIKTKTGAYIAPFSRHTGEEEVLIPAGVQFKVLERKAENDGFRFVLEEVGS